MTQITLITGANRGIGRATALELARQGHDIVLTYRSHAQEADAVVADIEALGRRAVALALDVADASAIAPFAARLREELASRWAGVQLTAIVNNAGHGADTTLATTEAATLDGLYATHVRGVYLLTQALVTPADAAPLLADGGDVVLLGTGLTRFVHVGRDAYAAIKGALDVLTRYWAQELGARGIRVNMVAPGPVETAFSGWEGNDQVRRVFADATALGRGALAEDVAGVIAGVLAPGAGWVTAQRIEASGGYRL